MQFSIFLCLCLANMSAVLAASAVFPNITYSGEHNRMFSKNLTARVYPGFQAGGPTPWPRRGGGLHTISYCYVDQNARDRLKQIFDAAINIWMQALGGGPSAQTGHALEFREYAVNGHPFYCYLDAAHTAWNQMVPTDFLALHWYPGFTASSTVGYRPHPPGTVPGRNNMQLGSAQIHGITWQVAHELGHIVGLIHEHQRLDRDDHIRYNPRVVQGYTDAVRAARAATGMTEAQVAERFANDGAFTSTYWGLGANFAKYTLADGNYWMHSGYDIASIMHYESRMAAADSVRARVDTNACPMLDKYGRTFPANTVPSRADCDFIREFYPWR